MKALPDSVSAWLPGSLFSLGTDGFGRSDGRAALRDFFEVDHKYIVVAALKALADEGSLDPKTVVQAIATLGIDPAKPNPVTV
jgi:pyruvate dehydrogenase E1 component